LTFCFNVQYLSRQGESFKIVIKESPLSSVTPHHK
jgi:hypothetical protein